MRAGHLSAPAEDSNSSGQPWHRLMLLVVAQTRLRSTGHPGTRLSQFSSSRQSESGLPVRELRPAKTAPAGALVVDRPQQRQHCASSVAADANLLASTDLSALEEDIDGVESVAGFDQNVVDREQGRFRVVKTGVHRA